IARGDRHAGLAGFFDELDPHDRPIRIRLHELRVDETLRWRDLPVHAAERDLSLRMAVHEPPRPADAQVDLADGDRVTVAERAPPPPDLLRLHHRLEDERAGRIEHAR